MRKVPFVMKGGEHRADGGFPLRGIFLDTMRLKSTRTGMCKAGGRGIGNWNQEVRWCKN
jgi:hypothetical protein